MLLTPESQLSLIGPRKEHTRVEKANKLYEPLCQTIFDGSVNAHNETIPKDACYMH